MSSGLSLLPDLDSFPSRSTLLGLRLPLRLFCGELGGGILFFFFICGERSPCFGSEAIYTSPGF